MLKGFSVYMHEQIAWHGNGQQTQFEVAHKMYVMSP